MRHIHLMHILHLMRVRLFSKYTILPTVCLAIVGFVFFTSSPHPLWGIIGTIADIGLLLLAAGVLIEKKWCSKLWIGASCLLLLYILVASLLYIIIGISPSSIFLLDCIVWLIAIHRSQPLPLTLQKPAVSYVDAFALPIFAGQLVLFQALLEKSTDIALGSPWLLTGNRFFLLFGIVLALQFFYQYSSSNKFITLFLLVTQSLLTFSVAAIIYKLGFGYDPMLHRAAQEVIFQEGIITPKTPFYIGQYVTVVGTAFLTHLPLKLIDIALVPILSAIVIPLLSYVSFKDGFNIQNKVARILALLVPIFPLQYFIVTTPHNFATLITFVTLLLLPLVARHAHLYYPLFTLSAFAATAIHPLSGIFAIWLWIGATVLLLCNKYGYKKLHSIFLFLYSIVGAVLTPAMIGVYNTIIAGQNLPPITNLLEGAPIFISLFKRPYYYINRDPDLIIQALYTWQWLIPLLLVTFSLIFLFIAKKTYLAKNLGLYVLPLLMAPIILCNMYFLSTWIVNAELGSYEQIQYAERLRHVLGLCLLPTALAGIGYIIHWNIRQPLKNLIITRVGLAFFCILGALLMTGSWYLTYPQRNEMVHFPGYNASASDYKAAEIIANTPDNISYIVLSNIMTAGASIEQFGFTYYFETDKGLLFHYPIPSGSPLYQAYSDMLYHDQKRETIDQALQLTGADKAYFLVHQYWANAPQIIAGAKKTADSWQLVDDGVIWIFEYN